MSRNIEFDPHKADMAQKIFDYALKITDKNQCMAIGLILKIIAMSCCMSKNPGQAYAEMHAILDEYEESENRMPDTNDRTRNP